MAEINYAYRTISKYSDFAAELRKIRKKFQVRPTPVSYLGRLSEKLGTGVGQHGVALVTAAAYFGLECDIYWMP